MSAVSEPLGQFGSLYPSKDLSASLGCIVVRLPALELVLVV